MTTPDLRRLARFRDGIDRSRAAASAARSRGPAPVAGLAAAIPLPNTDGPVLAARQVRAAAGADCPHCGGGRQFARVGAAPGAGLAGEIEATETNSAVSGLYDSLPAELRTALEDRFEDLAFHVPPEESRGSTCPLSAGAPEACTPYQPPKDVRSDGEAVLATVDSLYGSQVDIDARTCSTRFATLLRVAWTFLVRNADVIEWATCLTHGAAYRRRIVNKLTFSGFGDFRADIHCDDGAGLHGVLTPCTPAGCSSKDIATGACEPFLATSFALFGINICTSTGNVDKWIELFEHGSWRERLCAIVDCAGILVHELTHVTLTWRSGDLAATNDDDLDNACALSHLLESVFRWAIYQRYPQALEAACCVRLIPQDPDGQRHLDLAFMNTDPDSVGDDCNAQGS